jgi:uncharacterized protein YndB with AHSA1/START domain
MEAQGTGAQLSLEVRRTYPHPREKVFEAWTNAAVLSRWFSPSDAFTVDVEALDVRVGGRFAIVMNAPDGAKHRAVGAYAVVERPSKLAFTWAWTDNPAAGEMFVTLDFLEHGAGTELVLTHERLVSEESKLSHAKGWNGCLAHLASQL